MKQIFSLCSIHTFDHPVNYVLKNSSFRLTLYIFISILHIIVHIVNMHFSWINMIILQTWLPPFIILSRAALFLSITLWRRKASIWYADSAMFHLFTYTCPNLEVAFAAFRFQEKHAGAKIPDIVFHWYKHFQINILS